MTDTRDRDSAADASADRASDPAQRTTMGIIFLTLFLDLVGFAIIFPLFPAILDHYFAIEGADSLIGRTVHSLTKIAGAENAQSRSWLVQTLFGGLLGSIYSLLQFLFSPFWGRLSDRHGRRPILILTVAGIALSYGIWFFSGSFLLLIISRVLGGVMGGNISAATAAMADITTRENRAKGMGVVGAAFGLGFILGPALGGALAGVDLSTGSLAAWGVNPFSAAAGAAFLLSLLNLFWLATRFRETLSDERRATAHEGERSINPVLLFGKQFGSAVRTTHVAYFVFLLAFSGIEFTLTFLVRERLGWGPRGIAVMFVYVGVIIALVQGGVVRRVAPKYGEKRIAILGLFIVAPSLAMVGYADSSTLVFIGLAPMSIGSALAIPTMTSLVSLLSPENHQGAALGVFRSVGALSRALGPAAACIVYWRFGSAMPYVLGAIAMLLPIILLRSVPQPDRLG